MAVVRGPRPFQFFVGRRRDHLGVMLMKVQGVSITRGGHHELAQPLKEPAAMWLTTVDREYLRRSRKVAVRRHGPRHLGDLVWEHVTTLRTLICKESKVLRERSVPIEDGAAEDVELPLLRWSDGDALRELTQPLVHSSPTSIELMACPDDRQGQKRRGKTLVAPHGDRPSGQGLVLKGIGQFVLP